MNKQGKFGRTIKLSPEHYKALKEQYNKAIAAGKSTFVIEIRAWGVDD